MSFFIVCQQELYILFDDFSFSYFSTQKYHSDANTQHFKVNLMFDARKRLMDIKIRKNRTMRTVERANAYSGREEHQKDVFAFSWLNFMKLERNTVNCIIGATTTTTHERKIKKNFTQ